MLIIVNIEEDRLVSLLLYFLSRELQTARIIVSIKSAINCKESTIRDGEIVILDQIISKSPRTFGT